MKSLIVVAFLVNSMFADGYRSVVAASVGSKSDVLNGLLDGYDKRFAVLPVTVGVTVHVLSLEEAGPDEFAIDFYLRQTWNDPRLTFSDLEAVGDEMVIDGGSQPFWEPDTFSPNEIPSGSHLAKSQTLRLNSSGDIVLTRRISTGIRCSIDAHSYPWGDGVCSLLIDSFSHEAKDVRFTWLNGQKSVSFGDLSLTNFKLAGYHVREMDFVTEPKSADNRYSGIGLDVRLNRVPRYFIAVHLIPITMFTVTSLMSLWIGGNDANWAKIGLSFGSVAMTSLCAKFTSDAAPVVQYTKACDVYTGLLVTVTFLVLLANVILTNHEEKDGKVRRHFPTKACKTVGAVLIVVLLTAPVIMVAT